MRSKKDSDHSQIFRIFYIHMITDICVVCTSYKHHTNREDLFSISVGRHVAEAHTGQTAEGEVERSNVDAPDGWTAARPINSSYGIVR